MDKMMANDKLMTAALREGKNPMKAGPGDEAMETMFGKKEVATGGGEEEKEEGLL
jgi:hypothetical protein